MIYYSKDHEWLDMNGDVATIGITRHAADALGDIVFVDTGAVGAKLAAGEAAGVIESVKAASDIYSPVAGTIVEGNARVVDEPDLINSDPEGEGWIVRLRLDDVGELSGLMDRAAYDAMLAAA